MSSPHVTVSVIQLIQVRAFAVSCSLVEHCCFQSCCLNLNSLSDCRNQKLKYGCKCKFDHVQSPPPIIFKEDYKIVVLFCFCVSALPPPVPPKFKAPFKPILRLLTSDVLLHILSTILSRTAAARSRSWSEAQFERVSGDNDLWLPILFCFFFLLSLLCLFFGGGG